MLPKTCGWVSLQEKCQFPDSGFEWNPKDKPELAAKRDGLSRMLMSSRLWAGWSSSVSFMKTFSPRTLNTTRTHSVAATMAGRSVLSSLKSLLETGEAMPFSPDCAAKKAEPAIK